MLDISSGFYKCLLIDCSIRVFNLIFFIDLVFVSTRLFSAFSSVAITNLLASKEFVDTVKLNNTESNDIVSLKFGR